jgi:hypothetical protein
VTETSGGQPVDRSAVEHGPAESEPAESLDTRVITGNPTDEELAAVTAVLRAAVQEQGSGGEPLPVAGGRHWQRASGFLRWPLSPGPGEWRGF